MEYKENINYKIFYVFPNLTKVFIWEFLQIFNLTKSKVTKKKQTQPFTELWYPEGIFKSPQFLSFKRNLHSLNDKKQYPQIFPLLKRQPFHVK